MCGIAGAWVSDLAPDQAEVAVRRMTDAISHRGPDDAGYWSDPATGLVLGHRRLSIIDLSLAGHQPMVSAGGRHVIVFNGEIYNYPALRASLEARGGAPAWRGHSDTEVLLALIERDGVAGALTQAEGMFALAVWDREQRVLTLARDRMGEKPLYYGRSGGVLLFGSELKALTAHPRFRREIDRDAMTVYLRYNYVPAPLSIWRGIAKLPPGHLVEIGEGGRGVREPQAYWRLTDIAARGLANPLPDTPDTVDQLETLLGDAVERQMVADVPLGAFLSGGIDSSLIVALMQARSKRPVKTFTIGFTEAAYNEAGRAKRIAAHLGTEHTEQYVSPADALAVIPTLPHIYDEPFADSSQIPTHLVSRLARRHVTVSLSGDAGDELFGGYNRYLIGYRLFGLGQRVGPILGRAAAAAIRWPGTQQLIDAAQCVLPPSRRRLGLRDSLHKVAHAFEARSPEMLYRRFVSLSQDPSALVLNGREPPDPLSVAPLADVRRDMMLRDAVGYLPGDILAKVDRAAMAVSLETRVPYLDPRVVEFAWRLPASALFNRGQGKHILRRILYRHVPEALMAAPKSGFGMPVAYWLNHELRDWAESLLTPERLAAHGVFDPDAVRALWRQQLAGRPVHHQLWGILMAQAWLDAHVDGAAAAASMPFAVAAG